MRLPYRSELAALEVTYDGAMAADVEPLRSAAHAVGGGPAVFVGSGGSMVLAVLAARLHEWVCRQPARACTSLELLDLPQLDRRGAMLFSSSANHPDAQRALADFQRGRFGPTALVTHRAAADVQVLASPDTHIVRLPEPIQRDGFLATGSILQIATLLLRAYLDEPNLPAVLAADDGEAGLRDEVLVLSAPSLGCVAADIEVRLVESGLTCVQVADFRNFAHGRHTGFARRSEKTTVLVLSDAVSRPLADATAAALPASTDVRRWHRDSGWEAAVVALLARSMRLVASVGERVGVDVARPAVPDFGRRLYRLPLRRRLPDRLAAGVTRKLLASGSGDHAAGRAIYHEAAGAWTEVLAEQRFSGLVLDYDGTVCWTQQRWELPGARVRDMLGELLRRGLVVGFASGRGRSLHADLQRWVPPALWPQVVVGLYNGAVRLRLDDELPDLRELSAWSRAVVAAVADVHQAWRLDVEERGAQVSVAISEGMMHHGQLIPLLRDRLDDAGIAAQVVASGHSVDIVEPSSTKTAVADAVEQFAGGAVLAVGDQGQLGGNDHALLARTDWTLSVDRCSADPARCWFAGAGDLVGPDLLVSYVKALRKRRDGFAVTGITVS
ncbi:MAG: hypothetical protein MSC31_17115 [Solirubrobacteraceae bacterium MAG38_C4-C5]|nr:hypothetical protein [Candidatus Siliceabacter maunaloa]